MSTQTKILIVGDGGVGKTCAIERHFTDYFQKKYIPGDDVEKHIFEQHIIYDFPGQRMFNFKELTREIGDIDSAVIMFDLTSDLSKRNTIQWGKIIEEKFGKIPVKLVGNKADLVNAKTINNIISAKKGYNLDCVF